MRRAVGAFLAALVAFGATAASAAWAPGGGGTGSAASVALGVPLSVAAAATGTSSVHVSWSAPSTGPAPARYVVRRTAPSIATVCTVTAPTTTCDDAGLAASTTYQYTVQALLGTAWASGQSTAVSATTDGAGSFAAGLAVAGTKTAGTPFDVTLTATTDGTTTDTSYTGPRTITFSGPSNAPDGAGPTYPSSVTFVAGVGTATITLRDAETATVNATDGTIAGSTTVTVAVGPATRLGFTSTSDACDTGTAHVGNGGTFTFKVTAYDANLNPKPGARTVSLSRSPTSGTTLGPASLAITGGHSETTSSASLTIPVGNPTITLTAASSGLTSAVCTVKK